MDIKLSDPVKSKSIISKQDASPLQLAKALDRVMGDKELIKLLIEEFLGSLPADIDDIRQSMIAGAADELSRKAHALKGAAAALSMEPLAEISFMLEKQGKSGQLDSTADLFRQLQREAERVKTFIDTYDWNDTE